MINWSRVAVKATNQATNRIQSSTGRPNKNWGAHNKVVKHKKQQVRMTHWAR